MDIFNNQNLKPMLLREIDKPFDSKDYLFEIKFDGVRALIYVASDEILIKSRNGKVLNKIFPELLSIKKIVKSKCIFDGEIVLMYNNKPSFKKLQERLLIKNDIKIKQFSENYPVSFVCFDILYEDKNLTNLTLIERKKILSKYKDNDIFVKSRVVMDKGIDLFNVVKDNNLEGIVAKLKNSKYIFNIRSKDWIKIKNMKEDIFFICGYKIKDNVVSLLLGDKINNKFKFVGKVILGKKRKELDLIKPYKIVYNKLIDFDEESYIYIEPKLKCKVVFVERTNNNHLRHAVFKEIVN